MYDTLDNVLADGLSRLGDGAANLGSPWRNVALATVGLDGRPQVRTVVLRRFDRVGRLLDVHTDIRSAKHAELRAHADAALHGWDAEARVQLRVAGKASLHTGDRKPVHLPRAVGAGRSRPITGSTRSGGRGGGARRLLRRAPGDLRAGVVAPGTGWPEACALHVG